MSNKQIHLDRKQREAAAPLCGFDEQGYCVTCSDEAARAKVVSVNAEACLALVALGDTMTEIDVSLVEDVTPGGWVLVQGGVAIGWLGEAPDGERSPVREAPQ